MSTCNNCIHDDVCGLEDNHEEAITFCADMISKGYGNGELPNGGWISVNERLPEDGTYLITVKRISGNLKIDILSFAKDLNKVDEFDFPEHKYGWYDYDSEFGYYENTDVIAWMPLPKPYKAESEETNG